MKYLSPRLTVGLALAGVVWFAAAAKVSATMYIYDAQRYDTLPVAQGWTEIPGGGGETQNIVDNALVVTDNNIFLRGYSYTTNHFGVSINQFNYWQTRAMVRVENTDDGTTRPLFAQIVADSSTRSSGVGLHYIASGVGSNQFYFWNDFGAGTIDIPWNPTSFYQVVHTKPLLTPATIGVIPETIQVFDENGNQLGATLSRIFGSDNGGLAAPALQFGSPHFGAPTGTFQLRWATFGINEDAPFLIPEPSTAMLGLLGGFIAYRRMKRR